MDEKKKKELAIRSSAAEYLTFVASTGESDASYEMRYEDENISPMIPSRAATTAASLRQRNTL